MSASTEKFYFLRLLPPRTSFGQDMTPAEGAAMRLHVAYWTENLNAGHAIVFGPVADPKGSWGLGILRVRDEAQLRGFMENDPVILAGIGCRYEVLPMAMAVTRA